MPHSIRRYSILAVLVIQTWAAMIGMAHHEPCRSDCDRAEFQAPGARADAEIEPAFESDSCLMCECLAQDKLVEPGFSPQPIRTSVSSSISAESQSFDSSVFISIGPRGPPQFS